MPSNCTHSKKIKKEEERGQVDGPHLAYLKWITIFEWCVDLEIDT